MGGADDLRPTVVPFSAILLAYKDQTATIDVSAAVSVRDVMETILSVFHLKASTRIILKRSSDGAVMVPGPKLAPGEYTVEEIESKIVFTSSSSSGRSFVYERCYICSDCLAKQLPRRISCRDSGSHC